MAVSSSQAASNNTIKIRLIIEHLLARESTEFVEML